MKIFFHSDGRGLQYQRSEINHPLKESHILMQVDWEVGDGIVTFSASHKSMAHYLTCFTYYRPTVSLDVIFSVFYLLKFNTPKGCYCAGIEQKM